jgi:hypothetical protein
LDIERNAVNRDNRPETASQFLYAYHSFLLRAHLIAPIIRDFNTDNAAAARL